MNTPLAIIIFNRPGHTARLLESLKCIKPRYLYVIADGPRPGNEQDVELCKQTRDSLTAIDWPCDIKTNFSEINLGCGQRPVTGLNWLFEQVDKAIILEDDCIPDPSFFTFCQTLLEKYKDESKIGQICGSNFMLGRYNPPHSYYFSLYPLCWGWATWKRSWILNDWDMSNWPELRKSYWLQNLLQDRTAEWYWKNVFDKASNINKSHVWDYQWVFSCWVNNMYSIIPRVNMISNIGIGSSATHTIRNNRFMNLPAKSITLPLDHPNTITRSLQADIIRQHDLCSSKSYLILKQIIKSIIDYTKAHS